MVKAATEITLVDKEGISYVAYKKGAELSPEHAWEFEQFNKALLDSYEIVNGKYVLKPGEKKVEKPASEVSVKVERKFRKRK